jgi:hypothetical protein
LTTGPTPGAVPSNAEIGEYCRQVESHLTRANGGHLVRVVGPGFELVRQWALDGVPLSVVYRAIDDKAERHRAGASARPLRIEYCEADVRESFDAWRRAVGVFRSAASDEPAPGKAPSLTRHLDRVIDRLSRASGRVDLPDAVRDAVLARLPEFTAIREQATGARGPRKEALREQLPSIDRALMDDVRAATRAGLIAELRREAERELAAYRGRIAPAAWDHALEVTVDRLLRERFGLPDRMEQT